MSNTLKGLTVNNICVACGGEYYGPSSILEKEITGAERDSRVIEEGFLYIPFKGANADGHDFIPDVFSKGALVTLSEKKLDGDYPYILVDNTAQALKDIAEFYRKTLKCKVIGITGSVGKTSTKEMIASVVSQKFNVLKTSGNYNNEIGVPLTILRIKDDIEVAVVEMGISDFGEMHRLSKIARPNICVITNIGTCHLDNLNDRDGVLKAKTEIFDYAADDAVAVFNGDDDKLIHFHDEKASEVLYFSAKGKSDAYAKDYTVDKDGTKLNIVCKGEEFSTYISIPGFHMIYNALAATLVGRKLGMDIESIDIGIRSARTIGGRNNMFKSGTYKIIDDCYNANPMSMKASLSVLSKMDTRKVAILGDMFELGKDTQSLHREVGEYAGECGIDKLIAIGNLAKNIEEGAKSRGVDVTYFESVDDFIKDYKSLFKDDDTILIKASNGMKFKRIVELFK